MTGSKCTGRVSPASPTNDDTEAFAKLLVPAPADLLVASPVSMAVNNTRNDRADLIRGGKRGSARGLTSRRNGPNGGCQSESVLGARCWPR
jgi:hypothetical protein